jgi:23S rRNA (cytidine1920-2'-O)/16S rRNA (cytidine1409-2'-O)-methyltransferase
LCDEETKILAMFKPQFEANTNSLNRGIIKNSKIRRQIVKDFETWLKKNNFFVEKSTDSKISGSKGNLEKFFLLKKTVNY